jgi:hypothetical protein
LGARGVASPVPVRSVCGSSHDIVHVFSLKPASQLS